MSVSVLLHFFSQTSLVSWGKSLFLLRGSYVVLVTDLVALGRTGGLFSGIDAVDNCVDIC